MLRATRLVLVEDDAGWPLVASAVPTETMVIAQGGDPYGEFVERAVRRLAALPAAKRCVASAMLAAGPRADAQAMLGREVICRSLADVMTGGELLIVLRREAPEVRGPMSQLSEELRALFGARDLAVRIEAATSRPSRPPRSGTRLRRVDGPSRD